MSRVFCALLLVGLLVAGCGEKGEPDGADSDGGVGFAERAELRSCGVLGLALEDLPKARVADPAYACFRKAAHTGDRAELRAVSVNEEGRVPTYLRTLGPDGVEIYADTRHGGNGETGFYLRHCDSIDADLRAHGCDASEFVGGGAVNAKDPALPPQLEQVENALAGGRFTIQAVPPSRTHPKAVAELRIFDGAMPVGRVAQWRAVGHMDMIRLSQFGHLRVTMVICGRTAFAPVGHAPAAARTRLFEVITGNPPLDCSRLIST